jgi:glycosyltransferase involved in cell wall biosynthesis
MLRRASFTGSIDPRALSPKSNFFAGGSTRRLQELDLPDDHNGVSWQASTYDFTDAIAKGGVFSMVIDLGTGTGVHFQARFASKFQQTLQVDRTDQREQPADGSALGPFQRANLESYRDLEALASRIKSTDPILIILADVLQKLQDIRPLMRTLRQLLHRNAQSRLVLSTPDRHRIKGQGADGIPGNDRHVRQWTLNELGCALSSAGFKVEQIGWTKNNEDDVSYQTVCCELSSSAEYYESWRSCHGLGQPSDHLVITTEHADADLTGGIGTYVATAASILNEKPLVLFAGLNGIPGKNWLKFVRSKGWMHVMEFDNGSDVSAKSAANLDADAILDAVLQVIFLLDRIRVVEYQDYKGVGFRVAQAKRAGLLPASVTVVAYAHGNHFYLDAAADRRGSGRSPLVDVTERLSLELADVAAFPTRYLRDLYIEQGGYRVRSQSIVPCPATIAPLSFKDIEISPINTLVFFGKQTIEKGYYDFLEAVQSIFRDPGYREVASKLKELVLIGVGRPDERLRHLSCRVVHGIFSHHATLEMLRKHAKSSLVIMPYRGDNHPLSVLEAVGANCQILAFQAGGLPELLPEKLWGQLLCKPEAESLAAGIERATKASHSERCELIRGTSASVRAKCERNVSDYRAFFSSLTSEMTQAPEKLGNVSVVIANLNGETRHLADVAFGLRNSFHRPSSVTIVDDGSDDVGREKLEASIKAFDGLHASVVYNEKNKGLAGARNVGLEMCRTPYICTHDNDDVVKNQYFRLACEILDRNPNVAAVTAFSNYFDDGTDWQLETWNRGYRPLGADLGVGLRKNILGAALSIYRVSDVRQVGGWNEASKAKWEDWELFLKLLAAGKDIWVIPSELFLYRVRQRSMLRTYSEFPAWLRLANAFPDLPKSQAISVVQAIWNPLPRLPNRGENQLLQAQDQQLTESGATHRIHSRNWAASIPLTLQGIGYLLLPLGKKRRNKRRSMLAAIKQKGS